MMKINDLIKELEKLKEIHGNIKVGMVVAGNESHVSFLWYNGLDENDEWVMIND